VDRVEAQAIQRGGVEDWVNARKAAGHSRMIVPRWLLANGKRDLKSRPGGLWRRGSGSLRRPR
jgi:hypothetical protein